MKLEECEIVTVQDWKRIRFEEREIGRLLERLRQCVSLWFPLDLSFFELKPGTHEFISKKNINVQLSSNKSPIT